MSAVALAGELTVGTVAGTRDRLVAALLADGDGPLELDLAAVDDIDTAGVQLLLALQEESLGAGRPVVVTACSALVADTLRWLSLDPRTLATLPATVTA